MANGLNYNISNVLSFTTNNVKREVIDANGNHGFGVLSPTNLVDISGSTSTPLRVRGLADGTDARILATNANGVVSYRSDVLVGGSISDNVITLTETDTGTTDLTVQAVTAVTYNNAWDIALAGTGTIGSSPVDLPFVTGGTYSNGTITLGINGGVESNISITGIDGTDTFITSGTYTQSTGVIALGRNDGQTVTLTGTIDLIESGSITDNLITLTDNKGNDNTLQINAIDDLSYDSSFGLTVDGTGTISSSFELPFITGGTLDVPTGQLTLVMNGGLESDITISGFATSASDTFATGMTLTNGDLVITLNDGNDFNLDKFRWYFDADSGSAGTINLESQFDIVGGLGISTSSNGLSELTVALDSDEITVGTTAIALGASSTTLEGLTSVTSTEFSGDLTGNADTATALETGRNFSITGDITASAISFDGTGNVALSSSIADDAVTTDKILNGNVTNAKLANSSITFNAPSGTDPVTSLGGTLNLTSSDSSVTIAGNSGTGTIDLTVGAGVDKFVTGGTVSSGTATFTKNDASTFDVSGFGTVTSVAITGTDGIDVDSGSPITGAGTITLGLSNIPNSSLTNSTITLSDGSNSTSVALGGTMTFSDGTGLNVVESSGTVTYSIDNSVVTLTGSQTLTNKVINGSQLVDASVSNAKLVSSSFTIQGDSGSDQTISLGDTMIFAGGSGIDFVGTNTDTMTVNLDTSVVQFKSQKGQANGYASLDGDGKVPASQLPATAFEYKGAWNANTNSPTLADGSGDAGDVYRVATGGTVNLGSGDITFTVGDLALYDGAVWQRVDGADAVESVNGQTGVVVLDTDDISEGSGSNKWDKTVVLTSGTGISATGTYPNFTITNSDLGSSQNIFKTFAVPAGTAPVADSNSDTLTFVSSDSSVTISGNSTTDTIDIKVGGSVNTNIYTDNGTLSGARTVSQGGNTFAFTGGDFTVDGTTLSVDESASAVGIGVAAPDTSAVLEVASTTKGFLFPRMTETQRGNISSAATGLMVYQTDGDEGVYIKKSFGWVQVI